MAWHPERYAVTVADDFGKSSSVNLAIAEAHDRGILSAASIMTGEKAFEEAVRIAKCRTKLSVGLHVTLCDGKSVLPHSEIPDLVDVRGNFENSPAHAWIKYSKPCLQKQLEAEISAQFEALEKSGIQPGHVDSHHHLHMHPLLFGLICRHAARRNIQWVRIPYEPLSFVYRERSAARGVLPFIEWAVFGLLRILNKSKMGAHGLRMIPHTYGLCRTGHIDEQYLFNMIARQDALMELFFHPDIATESGRKELEALTSHIVRDRLVKTGIHVTGYQELAEGLLSLSAGSRSV